MAKSIAKILSNASLTFKVFILDMAKPTTRTNLRIKRTKKPIE